MSTSYHIEPIGRETIERSYPLAKAAVPTITFDGWRGACRLAELPRSHGGLAGDREHIVVASNVGRYVKGLCIHAVREHATYGQLLDIPLLVVASAADPEGVMAELVDFLRGKRDLSGCRGMRFWTPGGETWVRRLDPEYIARADHGLFMPASASAAEVEAALLA